MALSSLLEPDRRWMQQALREAERAVEEGEIPVGAVVVREGRVLGRGRNAVERLKDPTAHAELLAVTAACEALDDKFLTGCTLYVTLEPCPMCSGAIVLARLSRLVFGAYDTKLGASGSLYNITEDSRLNHRVEVVAGVEAERAAGLLRDFFRAKRDRG